jgi:hypothetical protein
MDRADMVHENFLHRVAEQDLELSTGSLSLADIQGRGSVMHCISPTMWQRERLCLEPIARIRHDGSKRGAGVTRSSTS